MGGASERHDVRAITRSGPMARFLAIALRRTFRGAAANRQGADLAHAPFPSNRLGVFAHRALPTSPRRPGRFATGRNTRDVGETQPGPAHQFSRSVTVCTHEVNIFSTLATKLPAKRRESSQ